MNAPLPTPTPWRAISHTLHSLLGESKGCTTDWVPLCTRVSSRVAKSLWPDPPSILHSRGRSTGAGGRAHPSPSLSPSCQVNTDVERANSRQVRELSRRKE